MDDSFFVSGAKPLGNLFERNKRFTDRDETARGPLGVFRKILGEDFYGNVMPKLRVRSPVGVAHPALADLLQIL